MINTPSDGGALVFKSFHAGFLPAVADSLFAFIFTSIKGRKNLE